VAELAQVVMSFVVGMIAVISLYALIHNREDKLIPDASTGYFILGIRSTEPRTFENALILGMATALSLLEDKSLVTVNEFTLLAFSTSLSWHFILRLRALIFRGDFQANWIFLPFKHWRITMLHVCVTFLALIAAGLSFLAFPEA
jgi:hypothetical protein